MWPTGNYGSVGTVEGAGPQPTTYKQSGRRAQLRTRNLIIAIFKMRHNRPKTDLEFYLDSGHLYWEVRNRIIYFILLFYNSSNKLVLAHFIINRIILMF
jgi:hypothetical protein